MQPVLIGSVPTIATIALVGWVVRLVAAEIRINLFVGADRYVRRRNAETDGAQLRSDMLVSDSQWRQPRFVPKEEFTSIYEPMHQRARSSDPTRQGFQVYREFAQIRAHKLTPNDLSNFFPAGGFITDSESRVDVRAGQFITINDGGDVAVLDEDRFAREYNAIVEVISAAAVSQQATMQQWKGTLLNDQIYSKCSKVHAKLTTDDGELTTVVDGKVEARRPYQNGDYLVLGSRGTISVNDIYIGGSFTFPFFLADSLPLPQVGSIR